MNKQIVIILCCFNECLIKTTKYKTDTISRKFPKMNPIITSLRLSAPCHREIMRVWPKTLPLMIVCQIRTKVIHRTNVWNLWSDVLIIGLLWRKYLWLMSYMDHVSKFCKVPKLQVINQQNHFIIQAKFGKKQRNIKWSDSLKNLNCNLKRSSQIRIESRRWKIQAIITKPSSKSNLPQYINSITSLWFKQA